MLQQFVMTSALGRGEWLPSSLTYKEDTLPTDDTLSGKVYADVIEAILGLVFLEWDFEATIKVRLLFGSCYDYLPTTRSLRYKSFINRLPMSFMSHCPGKRQNIP